jgi:hypothetical protein
MAMVENPPFIVDFTKKKPYIYRMFQDFSIETLYPI